MKASDFDLVHLYNAEDRTRRWRAESENAAARLELAKRDENAARLLSQHEPVHSLASTARSCACYCPTCATAT